MHIGITQRVVTIEEICERRDTLDQRWTSLMTGLGFTPIPLPNMLRDINAYLRDIRLDGVVLTGGDDILGYATERRPLSQGLATGQWRGGFPWRTCRIRIHIITHFFIDIIIYFSV